MSEYFEYNIALTKHRLSLVEFIISLLHKRRLSPLAPVAPERAYAEKETLCVCDFLDELHVTAILHTGRTMRLNQAGRVRAFDLY